MSHFSPFTVLCFDNRYHHATLAHELARLRPPLCPPRQLCPRPDPGCKTSSELRPGIGPGEAILPRSSLSYSRRPKREYITPMLSSRPFRSFLTCFFLNLQARLPREISPLEPVLTEIAARNSPRMNTYANYRGGGTGREPLPSILL